MRIAFLLIFVLLPGALLAVAWLNHRGALPQITFLTDEHLQPVTATSAGPAIESPDALLQLRQSVGDMQMVYQTLNLRLQQLEYRLLQVESIASAPPVLPVPAKDLLASTDAVTAKAPTESATSIEPAQLTMDNPSSEAPELAIQIDSDTSEPIVAWFVHIGLRPNREQANALAAAITELMGLVPRVLPGTQEGFMVRLCDLPTQVKAQEAVQVLRRTAHNEALWIGRGCEPN